MITTIIFDLSDVYIQGIYGSHTRLEKVLSVPVSDLYFDHKSFYQFLLGQITEDEYWKSIIKKNSWNISVDLLKKNIRKNFIEIQGTRQIIEQLKRNGYMLVLLSNHAKEWAEYCEKKFSYHTLFEQTLYSYQIGLSKPDKKIFRILLKNIKKKAEECLFIDDNAKNIYIADQIGMKTIQFASPHQLKNELIKKEINIE